MSTAARHGNIDCMRVLYMAGVAWDIRTTVAAILTNQLDSLRFLHARGCEFPTNSCWWVVRYHGSIDVLRFLHEEAGADLTGTLLTAAENGNLRCFICFAVWRCMRSDASGPIGYSLEWWGGKLVPCALAFLITVAYYKKHLGHYLSEHNAEHIMLSYLCLVVMYWTMEGIFESSWFKIVLRVLAFLVFGLQVVLLNARRVQPPELPSWYKLTF
eukprot:gene13955-16045_t